MIHCLAEGSLGQVGDVVIESGPGYPSRSANPHRPDGACGQKLVDLRSAETEDLGGINNAEKKPFLTTVCRNIKISTHG